MRSSSVAVRVLSLLLFLLLIGVIAYWSMQLLAPRAAIAPSDSLGDNSRPPLPAAAKLFGAPNQQQDAGAPPPVDVRVTGILEAGRRGVAILAINGAPAKAYQVNQRIDDGTTLKEVLADKVILDHRGSRIEAVAPSRYSIDILSSNAGRSGPPDGIEELAPTDDPAASPSESPAAAPDARPLPAPQPGMPGMPPPGTYGSDAAPPPPPADPGARRPVPPPRLGIPPAGAGYAPPDMNGGMPMDVPHDPRADMEVPVGTVPEDVPLLPGEALEFVDEGVEAPVYDERAFSDEHAVMDANHNGTSQH